MAEADTLPYVMVIFTFGLIFYLLYSLRNTRKPSNITLKNPRRFTIALFAIILCYVFFVSGWSQIEESKIFKKHYVIYEDFEPDYTVHFEETAPQVSWMDEYNITKPAHNDPLVIGNQLGFLSHVNTKELPQELVIHIFHEDMESFFTGSSDVDFRDLAEKLGKIPIYNNHNNIFKIEFPLTEEANCNSVNECHYNLNAENMDISFSKPGKYFGQISVKTADGKLDHQKTRLSLFTILEPSEVWMIGMAEAMEDEAVEQRSLSYFSIGMTSMGIGFAILFVVFNYLFGTFGRKPQEQ